MITRIPQPQFVGPAPSEALYQQQDVAQRQAAMLQQGIQEGMKNYLTQKSLEIEKQKAEASAQYNQEIAASRVSAEDQAKQLALSKQLEEELGKVGPESQWQVWLEQKPLAKQYFMGLAGNDKDLAESLYQSTLKTALSYASPTSMLSAGVLGMTQPQGVTPVNGQGVTAAAPGTVPAVPPTASPPAAASTPGTPPPGMPPIPTPATPQATPVTATPPAQPTDPAQGFWNYMQQTHAGDNALGAWKGQPFDPTKAQTLAANNPGAYQTFLKTQGQTQAAASATQAASITQITKGLPDNAVTQTATGALSKLAGIAMGNVDADTSMTPKEQASIRNVLKPHVEILRNSPILEELTADTGPVAEQAAQKAADWLNNALQDPDFSKWLQTSQPLSKAEADDLAKTTTDQAKIDQITAAIQNQAATQNRLNLQAATTAAYDLARTQSAYAALQVRAQQTNDKEAQINLQEMTQMRIAGDTFAQLVDTAIKNNFPTKQGQSPDPAAVDAFLGKQFADPRSPISTSLNIAVTLYAAAMHIDPSDMPTVTKEWEARYRMGLPLPFLQTSPAGSSTTPYIPPAPPGPTPGPTPSPSPGPQPSPGATPPPLGRLTDAQKKRVAMGQAPGAP